MDKQLIVAVNTNVVLTTLVRNRDAHSKAHGELMRAWSEKMYHLSERLKDNLKKKTLDLPAIRWVTHRLSKVEACRPELMIDRYNEIIRMLEAHLMQQGTIELTQDQFKAYMEDNWDWKLSWITTSNTYMSDEES